MRASKKVKVLILISLFFFGNILTVFPSANSDLLIGTWQNASGEVRVEIYKKGHMFFGKLDWLKNPYRNGKPKTDIKNPNPALRSRPVIGLIIIREFMYEGNFVWDNGKVYDPDSGNDYSCKLRLLNRNSLEVRGFIAISLIGRTEVWTRIVK